MGVTSKALPRGMRKLRANPRLDLDDVGFGAEAGDGFCQDYLGVRHIDKMKKVPAGSRVVFFTCGAPQCQCPKRKKRRMGESADMGSEGGAWHFLISGTGIEHAA